MPYTLTVHHNQKKDQERGTYANAYTRHQNLTPSSTGEFDDHDTVRSTAVDILTARNADPALIEAIRHIDLHEDITIDITVDEETEIIIRYDEENR